ncbi:hypothetical protein NMG60_11036661 [Bertholletia excelsa]
MGTEYLVWGEGGSLVAIAEIYKTINSHNNTFSSSSSSHPNLLSPVLVMKVVKTLKKLKFWSRKKKKKKTQLITDQYYPLPPPPCYCSYSWVPVQPSAPPLPPWFESKQTHIQAESGRIGPSRPEFVPQEIVPELNSLDPEARDSCASYPVHGS